MKTAVLLAALLGTAAAVCSNSSFPQVTIESGVIEGFCITSTPVEVNAFLSVPWGKPPLGELRFEKPQKVDAWSGVVSTKVQPPRCRQNMTADPNSEDCLYLNVFAPVAPSSDPAGYPVIVEVHGGAFLGNGARANGAIGMSQLLSGKGTVVVSIQYRVGPLGFFTTGDGVMKGNYAMWDFVMQLQWVQDNIAAFGGNPDSVTLHGGSAGAGIIDCCSISPACYDLFHKAWAYSGSARELGTSDVAANSFVQAAWAGFTWTDSIDLKAQLKAATNISGMLSGWGIVTQVTDIFPSQYMMVPDGDFFPNITQTQMRLNAPVKPRIFGNAWLEGAAMTGNMNITQENYEKLLNFMVPLSVPNRSAWYDMLKAEYDYLAAVYEPDAQLKHRQQQSYGERMLVAATKDVADRLVNINNGTQDMWLYVFNYLNPAAYGSAYPYQAYASHALDGVYTIGSGAWAFNSDDYTMMEWLSRALTNFAKTGNPNTPTALPTYWDKQDSSNIDRHMQWTMSPFITTDYFGGRIKINNDLGHAYNPNFPAV